MQGKIWKKILLSFLNGKENTSFILEKEIGKVFCCRLLWYNSLVQIKKLNSFVGDWHGENHNLDYLSWFMYFACTVIKSFELCHNLDNF